jgi:ribonuclease H / adenosylcobalamin/alpha-ribazole phosphatase
MLGPRQFLLIRHGETNGASSIRYFGSTDVDLSDEGREQMAKIGAQLAARRVDLWVASNLRRSWQAAGIIARGAPVRIEADFREIHFGQWEGLTREEIQARDPVAFQDWQAGREGFEYPGGESRASFRARIGRGVERLLASPTPNVAAVLHKGVIREIVRQLGGEALNAEHPQIAGITVVTRVADGPWIVGQRSSDPAPLSVIV